MFMSDWLSSYFLPGVEVHACEFRVVRFSNVHIQALTLVDVHRSVGCHVYNNLLRNLPHCLVQLLQVVRNSINMLRKKTNQLNIWKDNNLTLITVNHTHLHRAAICNHLIFHVVIPQVEIGQVLEQVVVDTLKDEQSNHALVKNFVYFTKPNCVRSKLVEQVQNEFKIRRFLKLEVNFNESFTWNSPDSTRRV